MRRQAEANLSRANLSRANLWEANLSEANLIRANLTQADLREADLTRSNMGSAYLWQAWLDGANLNSAILSKAILIRASLRNTILINANISEANLRGALLDAAVIRGASFRHSLLQGVSLSGADLREVDLYGARLLQVNLRGADLPEANLTYSTKVESNVDNAKLSKSNVYGISVWDLYGKFEEQKDLTITPFSLYRQPRITVDNIKVAQFIYLILKNEEIRDVINTLTSKTVLILGRFAIPERKAILDALRDKLREYDLLPIVFDFDHPTDKDFTETIKTLAGISYFVIADVTNPKSSPLELQATIPDYQIPFVPIIQEGEKPFAMMANLKTKYNWVLETISYDSLDTLIEILKPHIIDPAIKKRDELRLIKAKEPTIISGRDLKEKKKKGKL